MKARCSASVRRRLVLGCVGGERSRQAYKCSQGFTNERQHAYGRKNWTHGTYARSRDVHWEARNGRPTCINMHFLCELLYTWQRCGRPLRSGVLRARASRHDGHERRRAASTAERQKGRGFDASTPTADALQKKKVCLVAEEAEGHLRGAD